MHGTIVIRAIHGAAAEVAATGAAAAAASAIVIAGMGRIRRLLFEFGPLVSRFLGGAGGRIIVFDGVRGDGRFVPMAL